jgi:uncharacterized membrane protein YoaT (DUF817 family)
MAALKKLVCFGWEQALSCLFPVVIFPHWLFQKSFHFLSCPDMTGCYEDHNLHFYCTDIEIISLTEIQ